jgi:preprotein translocase subunit SecA
LSTLYLNSFIVRLALALFRNLCYSRRTLFVRQLVDLAKIMSFLTKIFGDPNAKVVKEIQPIVEQINSLEPQIAALTIEQLKQKTTEFKDRLAKGETLDDILPEAFAVVRETSKRLTGMRHFDVQLMGGIVLHRGQIAEMHTGEGKTLTATTAVYLNALTGKGVHLVTVNDYLAKRDAVWMGQIYDALGLSIGIIQNQMVSYRYNATKRAVDLSEGSAEDKERDAVGAFKVEYDYLDECSRQDVYKCDIVYGTNNEFGFDYLRDNMVQDLSEISQRSRHFAIVDEVDSILIDEARTPLIISAPTQEAADIYYKFAELVERLVENEDYNVDEKLRSSTLTDAGIKKLEGWLGIDNIYAEGGIRTVHHIEQALKAKALFKRDKDYVVEKEEVIIVDEFTGRKMPGRRYSEGLHQAIEAKEHVKIQKESQTMATITFQNFFRMYEKLSGMTGTAVTEAEEFGKIYTLEVVAIPTHRNNVRQDRPDKIFKTHDAKFRAIANQVKELQEKGQPVLIGTVSVEKNELLAMYLEQAGVKYEVLNAKNHEREGEIIAQAGKPGSVTLATNMAGRGVDIILGGNPPTPEDAEKVKTSGGLFVIGTERHESRRIDNQLRGRAGRQGDPGETQFYLSTEDDLMRIFAGDRIKAVMNTLRVPEDMPIEQKSLSKIIESAQKKVEGFHFDTRKHLLEYDDVLNRHREVIYGNRKKILESFAREKNPVAETTTPEATPETLQDMIFKMIEEEIEQIVSYHTNVEDATGWDMKEIAQSVVTIFPLTDEEKQHLLGMDNAGEGKLDSVTKRTAIIEYLMNLAESKYEEMIVKKANQPELVLEIEKQILLRSIDTLWIDHLVAIDYLRTGIGLRGYGQRDPLVEYKKETYQMFNELLNAIQKEVVYSIYKVSIGIELAPSLMEKANVNYQGAQKTSSSGELSLSVPTSTTTDGKEVGRNDPCWCGSGKKFKKCHGK